MAHGLRVVGDNVVWISEDSELGFARIANLRSCDDLCWAVGRITRRDDDVLQKQIPVKAKLPFKVSFLIVGAFETVDVFGDFAERLYSCRRNGIVVAVVKHEVCNANGPWFCDGVAADIAGIL